MSHHRSNYKGNWAASTIYDKWDAVKYDGAIYVSKEIHQSVSGSTPDVATYQWRPMTHSTRSTSAQVITPFIPLQRAVLTPVQKRSWPTHNWHLT